VSSPRPAMGGGGSIREPDDDGRGTTAAVPRGWAEGTRTKGKERLREIALKRAQTMGKERLRQAGLKGLAKRTPEQLSEAARKAAATRARNRAAKKNEGATPGS
jgi:phage/plasmid primase-like uncharacterized protein